MSKMELPIFSDNLRSSASWNALLARTQEAWRVAVDSGDSRLRVELRIRDQQVTQIAQIGHIRQGAGTGIDERRLHDAARLVSAWAMEARESREAGAELDPGRLLDLHRLLIGAHAEDDPLRKTEPAPINVLHDPTPAILLPRMLDNAFDWFTTSGFGELHAVEQAAVVYLRLLDLYPFPSHTEVTALLTASFYTERAGLPPLVIYADGETQARYENALDAAFRMLTQPLVEFFAEMLSRTMRQSLNVEE